MFGRRAAHRRCPVAAQRPAAALARPSPAARQPGLVTADVARSTAARKRWRAGTARCWQPRLGARLRGRAAPQRAAEPASRTAWQLRLAAASSRAGTARGPRLPHLSAAQHTRRTCIHSSVVSTAHFRSAAFNNRRLVLSTPRTTQRAHSAAAPRPHGTDAPWMLTDACNARQRRRVPRTAR